MSTNERIKELWEVIPNNAIELEQSFLSNIPLSPKCISAMNLRNFLGISKSTLSYHIKKHKKSISIFVKNKKHYYQRKSQEETL